MILLGLGNGVATIVLTKKDAGRVMEGADCRAAGKQEREQEPHGRTKNPDISLANTPETSNMVVVPVDTPHNSTKSVVPLR